MNDYKIMDVLESLKKDYFKDIPEEVADVMIRRLVYTLVTR